MFKKSFNGVLQAVAWAKNTRDQSIHICLSVYLSWSFLETRKPAYVEEIAGTHCFQQCKRSSLLGKFITTMEIEVSVGS
jgi:hypothetical protein